MMKKTILHIATAVMLLAIFTACEKEALQAAFEGNNGKSIRILLNAQGDDVTRAVSRSDGNDAYGENTIATADVFFYNAGGTLIYNVAKENVTLSEPDANGVVTATVPMPSSDENIDLTQATKVYVMGNRQATDGQVADTDKSEAALRALTFTTNLATDPTAETTFAMDGTGDIDVTDNEISGTVELVRNAAKITLTVNLPSTLTADDKTYKPQTKGITVTFNKGVKTFGDETDMFNVGQRVGIDGTADAEGNTPVSFEPFYSYPTTWETGEDNEPYFTLHVPWGETNSEGSVTSYTTYHYRVPINKTNFDKDENGTNLTTLSLKRNHWYQVSVNVGVLGTPEASDEVELTANYEVKPWGNLPIGADLLDFKYLVVDQEKVEIYNQNSVKIAYKSSDQISVVITSLTRPDYTGDVAGTVTYYNNSTGTNKINSNNCYGTSSVSEVTYKLFNDCEVIYPNTNSGEIEFSHVLINTDSNKNNDADGDQVYTNDYDYVPYTITIKVTNQSGYTQTINIKQYPAIYAIVAPNSDYDSRTGKSDNNGYVFINGNGDNDNRKGTQYGSILGLSGNNSNPNMYIINVTNLGTSSEFVIGDPRTTISTNLDNVNNWVTANKTYTDTDGILINYYPTANNTSNVIAPAFRIASSHGKTTSNSFESSQNRCASYQEDGYPAGRWRIPTEAESIFIAQLSANKIIPQLFGTVGKYSNTYYWTGSQTTFGSYDKKIHNDQSTAYVRCVYDDWYWGSNQVNGAITTFTWGDQPR